jgi:integrase
MKLSLTKSNVMTLPEGTHQDTKQPGLVVNVTAHSRRYGVYLSINNTPTRKAIGPVAEWSVEAARAEAARVISDLRTKPKVAPKPVVTLDKLVRLYESYLRTQGRKCPDYVDTDVRLSWEHLRQRDVTTITVLELTEEHGRIAAGRGPTAAKRAITTLRTLFAYGEMLELVEKNPAKKVRVAPEQSREVFLEPWEVAVFRECLDEMAAELPGGVDARDFYLLALLTGLRRSNLAGCRWEWLDLDASMVRVPAAASKNGKAMTLALRREAVEILRRRKGEHDDSVWRDSPWVFPTVSSAGCLQEVSPWLNELRRRMAEKGVTKHWYTHDLRRSFAVELTAAGAPLPVVAKALGHSSVTSTPVYARASTATVAEWLER